MSEAISSGSHSWLAWISLLPLFVAIRSLPPRKAGAFGAFWGCCLFLFLNMADRSVITPTFINFILLVAVPAIYAILGAVITRCLGFSPMGLALGWIGVELALQPLGLSFGLLSPLRGYGPFLQMVINFLGYGAIAFLIVLISASVIAISSRVRIETSQHFSIKILFNHVFYLPFEAFSHPSFPINFDRCPRAPPKQYICPL